MIALKLFLVAASLLSQAWLFRGIDRNPEATLPPGAADTAHVNPEVTLAGMRAGDASPAGSGDWPTPAPIAAR